MHLMPGSRGSGTRSTQWSGEREHPAGQAIVSTYQKHALSALQAGSSRPAQVALTPL